MGHLARRFEADGIATVIIAAEPFHVRLEAMTLPRLLLTPHVIGRVLGAPGDRARQTEVLMQALALLEQPARLATVRFPDEYRPPAPSK